MIRHCRSRSSRPLRCWPWSFSAPTCSQDPTVAIERLGGTVFRREGQVVEVNLNRTKVSDGDLRLLSGLTAMTDLSLEETADRRRRARIAGTSQEAALAQPVSHAGR